MGNLFVKTTKPIIEKNNLIDEEEKLISMPHKNLTEWEKADYKKRKEREKNQIM